MNNNAVMALVALAPVIFMLAVFVGTYIWEKLK